MQNSRANTDEIREVFRFPPEEAREACRKFWNPLAVPEGYSGSVGSRGFLGFGGPGGPVTGGSGGSESSRGCHGFEGLQRVPWVRLVPEGSRGSEGPEVYRGLQWFGGFQRVPVVRRVPEGSRGSEGPEGYRGLLFQRLPGTLCGALKVAWDPGTLSNQLDNFKRIFNCV